VATQFDGKFGFLNIDISNGNPHTKLTGTFYDNRDGNIADQFTIEKEIKNKDGDIQPDPQSASHASQNSNSDSNSDSNSNRHYLPSYNYNDK
jgi:hypothetical protein